MRTESRGPWYLFTGLILGGIMGLLYSWLISPTQYVDTAPSSLREDYKDQYRALIAAAYTSNGDLGRAKSRLMFLEDEDAERILALQAEKAASVGRPQSEVDSLGLLALAISRGAPIPPATLTASPSPSPTYTNTAIPFPTATDTPPTAGSPVPVSILPASSTPGPTETQSPSPRPLLPSITPLPTRTPTPTPGAPFVLAEEAALICASNQTSPLIMVEAYDAAGEPIPGVQVIVQWPGGEDRFFTGLKPELGLGYADFSLTPGIPYSVRLAEAGQLVSGLEAHECENPARERYWGSWRLVFSQP
jgi:hypothetical protein